jgi:hypothetical protein
MLIFPNIGKSQQINNGNFEDWGTWTIQVGLSSETHDTAAYWHGYFDVTINGLTTTIFTAEQSTDKYQGTYSVLLETKDNNGLVIPGVIQMGKLDFNSSTKKMGVHGGQAFSGKPTGIRAFLKYLPADNDTGFVYAYLTHWNGSGVDTVAMAFYPLYDTISQYKEIEFPFYYKTTTLTPDTINIVFCSSSIGKPKVGSKLTVDSVCVINSFVPYATLAVPPSKITQNSFYAKWIASPLSKEYYLDVAKDIQFTDKILDNKLISFSSQSGMFDSTLVDITGNSYPLYYRVRVKYENENATSANSNIMPVISNIPFLIKKVEKLTDFKVKNKMLFLYNLKKNSLIQIFTISGQELYNQRTNEGQMVIPFRLPGIYVIKIIEPDCIKKGKFSID